MTLKEAAKLESCPCRRCRHITKHEVIHEHTEQGEVPDDIALNWTHEYQTVRCLGCGTVAFRMATGTNENVAEVRQGEWEYVPDVEIFPTPNLGRAALESSHLLPTKVERIYSETLACLNASNPVLSGIGIRAIVETVCKDQGAFGRDLYQKINDLKDRRGLADAGATILHNLRVLGNNAAHEVAPHSVEELTLAIEVIDHLLLGVYVLPKLVKRTYGSEEDDDESEPQPPEPV